MLLNTALTTTQGVAGAHAELWKPFTINLIKSISKNKSNLIFILWGKHAQSYQIYIGADHYIFMSAHPSPFSANNGFFYSRPFSKINLVLEKINKKTIQWF